MELANDAVSPEWILCCHVRWVENIQGWLVQADKSEEVGGRGLFQVTAMSFPWQGWRKLLPSYSGGSPATPDEVSAVRHPAIVSLATDE